MGLSSHHCKGPPPWVAVLGVLEGHWLRLGVSGVRGDEQDGAGGGTREGAEGRVGLGCGLPCPALWATCCAGFPEKTLLSLG